MNIVLKLLQDQRGFISSLFGGGKKKKSRADRTSDAALQAQVALQQQQAGLLAPLQQQQVGVTRGLLGAAQEPAAEAFRTDISAPERETIESQFSRAREGVLQTGQRGGLMRSMLGNLDLARAQSVSQAINQAKQLGIGRALGFASGQNPIGITSALMGGAQGLTGSAQQAAQMAAGAQAARGQGYGNLIGTGLSLASRFLGF